MDSVTLPELASVSPAKDGRWAQAEALLRRCEGLGVACDGRAARVVPTGVGPIDAVLPGGGLRRDGVHEWIGTPDDGGRSGPWAPALGVLLAIARQARATAPEREGRLVWVGARVWPYLPTVMSSLGATSAASSLFVRAERPGDRLWSADLALRSGSVAGVIVDGSRFDLASTRRLQLASEASDTPCFLARPWCERVELSAAATRWLVSCAPSPTNSRRWNVELLRCKGLQPAPNTPRAWIVEQSHATRALRVVSDALERPRETPAHSRRTG